MKKRCRFLGFFFLSAILSLPIFSCSESRDIGRPTPVKPTKAAKSGPAPPHHGVMEPRPGAPPSGPRAPSSTISMDLAETMKARIKALTDGKILFNPPLEMKVDECARVEARIALDPTTDLTRDLQGPGRPMSEGIKVSPFMKVSLHGDDFHIDSYCDEEQPLVETSTQKFAQWQWDIKPLKSGVCPLVLTAKAVIKIPNNPDVYYDHPVLERQIHVKINPGYSVKAFFGKYWQWLASTIVIPLVIWLYSQRRKRRSAG